MKSRLLLLFSLLCVSTIHGATFSLDVDTTAPLYQTSLIKPVYQLSGEDALNDLTVMNADGEPVPFALVPYAQAHPSETVLEKSKPLVIFPMQEEVFNHTDDTNIQLNHQYNNTNIRVSANKPQSELKTSYLFDLGSQHPAMNKLSLTWEGEEGKLIPVTAMTSNDLKDWVEVGSAALFRASADNETISQNTIQFSRTISAHYLKITPKQTSDTFKLTAVNIAFNETQSQSVQLLWEPIPFIERSIHNQTVNIDFESPSRYPATAIMVQLPQLNTITKVTVQTRHDQQAPWRFIKHATVYRFNQQGEVLQNQAISIPTTTARYWRLSFSNQDGGIGNANPDLKLGWLPDTLVWNARGPGPFIVKINEAQQTTASQVPIHTLLKPTGLKTLKLLPSAPLTLVSSNQVKGVWETKPNRQTIWLWMGLFIGVFALASMTYSLLKNVPNKQQQKNENE